ncbi:R-spondin-4 [Polypterus senegalus]|uniref:R-spondin-4 n=1 Tax=Polypterus senegalus TaxID=55291 RepID=UPI0019652520|nr:R-spondin-4 [Polypterus senegalus]
MCSPVSCADSPFAQMHWRLFALLLLRNCVYPAIPTTRKLNASSDLPDDCKGCLECSGDNGCLKCPEKLFLYIQREGMRQHGSCVHACPPGHFGVRGQDVNRCIRCKTSNCESCFSKDFCMKCKGGFHLFKGKCLVTCPEGTSPHLSECVEGCQVGKWSEWGTCTKNGQTCGFRWGMQERTKSTQEGLGEESPICTHVSESRRCRMKKRCPGDKVKTENKNKGKKGKQPKKLPRNSTATEPPGGS